MLHDPTEVMWRMDHFGEQRGESGTEAVAETLLKRELAEEAMELGYQPGSNGEEDSDIFLSMLCSIPLQDATAGAVSAGWTGAHPKVRISTYQRVPRMPLANPQKRVRGRNSQPCQSPCEMRLNPWRGLPSKGRSHRTQPQLEATHLVTAREK